MTIRPRKEAQAAGLVWGPALAALLLAGLLFWAARPALAHGVSLEAGQGRAAWVLAQYSDGEPMSFAKVRVLGPGGQTHQMGNADATGRFCWLPDQPGQWTAVIEDGQGHRGQVSLDWTGGDAPVASQRGGGEMAAQPLWTRALLGLSAIFCLAGLVFWLLGRRGARRGAAAVDKG